MYDEKCLSRVGRKVKALRLVARQDMLLDKNAKSRGTAKGKLK